MSVHSLVLHNVHTRIALLDQPRMLDHRARNCGYAPLPKAAVGTAEMESGDSEWLGKSLGPRHHSLERMWRRLSRRNFRQLREDLVNLNIDSPDRVAEWLNDAGYVPKIGEQVGLEWMAEQVTPEIRNFLCKCRNAIAWLMTLPRNKFSKAIDAAWQLIEDQRDVIGVNIDATAGLLGDKRPKLRNPCLDFARALNIPSNLEPEILKGFLLGAGSAPNVHALFHWDRHGKPFLTIHADSPMDAIGLSVHIDKNFTAVREWVSCANCGKGFEQDRSKDRFCGSKCKNYYTTNARRKKIRVVKDADQAWNAMPAGKRRGRRRWQWIANYAKRRGKVDVDPAWAKQILATGKLSSGKTR